MLVVGSQTRTQWKQTFQGGVRKGLAAWWSKNSSQLDLAVGRAEVFLEEKQEFGRSSGEKAMAPHSSTLAWKIPWAEEPGRVQSMGSLRVGHDWATSLSLSTFMHWRRK